MTDATKMCKISLHSISWIEILLRTTAIVMSVFITHRSFTGNYPGERHAYSIILTVTTTFVHR